MINGKTVSLGSILWRIMKNPLVENVTYEQVAEYTLEFIKLVGAPLAFIDEVKRLELKEYKALLPNNMVNIKGVRYLGTDLNAVDSIAMRYATDIFHKAPLNENYSEFTYVVQSCVMTTSMKEGYVDIAYQAIAVDEDEFPLVPDNESFKMGLEYYILDRVTEPLWMMGKIPDKVFSYIQQQRYFYTGQASSALILQGTDQLESVMNGINRLITNTTAHETFFKNYGEKERFKTHS